MMRNCPHCQFLLTTDSDTCAVCNLPVEQPPPVPSGLVAAMASPEAATGSAAPGGAPPTSGSGTPPSWSVPGGNVPPTGPPSPGFSAPGFSAPGATPPWAPPPGAPPGPAGFQVAPVQTKGKGRVIAVVLGLVALLFVALVGLTFVGTTTESADVVPDRWGVYTDPAGRYSVQLPGTPVETNTSEEVPGVGTVTTDVAEVSRFAWSSAVVLVDVPSDAVQSGPLPLQPMVEAMFDGLEAEGVVDDVVISDSHPMDAPSGPGIEGNITTSQDGTAMVGRFRALQIGNDLGLIVTMGPAERQADVDASYARTVESFTTPAQ